MYVADNPYRILRASVLASALIGTALTLQMSEVLAQSGMSDMKKMPPITAVNTANHKVTFDHGPISAINWPAMTMEFAVAPSVDLAKLKTGDKVNFTLSGSGGTYTVQSISPAS